MATTQLLRREFEVLNVVALKKMCAPGAAAAALGVPENEVTEAVAVLESAGLVGQAGDLLLPSNDAVPALEAFAVDAYQTLREQPEADRLHERFERINGRFLAAMSSWQQVELGGQKVANDHSDPDYDARIIDDVATLVDRLESVIDGLAAYDERFVRYSSRFGEALARVDRGQVDYLVSPQVESVHNIWFELHEDLLRTLGRERKE